MRKHRVLGTTFAMLFALSATRVAQVWAQNGVISFWEACSYTAYVMRGEAESASNPRVMLLPGGRNAPQFFPLDMSTTGPVMTVLLHGLFAVQVNDIGGSLVPGDPTDIRLDADLFNLPVNVNYGFAKFSPTDDRVVIAAQADPQDQGQSILVIADIDKNGSNTIIGLKNPNVVVDLRTIGSPSDSNLSGGGTFITGFPDFSPDGNKIVVTSYGDLWLLTLLPDGHHLDPSQPPLPLTRTLRDSEWNAVFSPDGNRIAYISGSGSHLHSMHIFTLNLTTHEVTQVTPATTKSIFPSNPAWSPDGQFLAFTAQGERAPRGSCGVNYDIYQIQADGTSNPTLLTNTVGTGIEQYSQWGW